MPRKSATPASAKILLVENGRDDVLLTEEALRRGGMASDLRVVGDGEAAVGHFYLRAVRLPPPRSDLGALPL